MTTYSHNFITRKVSGNVPAYRLVKESDNGTVVLNGADTLPYGAVTEAGSETNEKNKPQYLRVSTAQGVVPVELAAGADLASAKSGATLYAAADGKVDAKGTVAVGILDVPAEHAASTDTRGVKTARVHLFHPAAK